MSGCVIQSNAFLEILLSNHELSRGVQNRPGENMRPQQTRWLAFCVGQMQELLLARTWALRNSAWLWRTPQSPSTEGNW